MRSLGKVLGLESDAEWAWVDPSVGSLSLLLWQMGTFHHRVIEKNELDKALGKCKDSFLALKHALSK